MKNQYSIQTCKDCNATFPDVLLDPASLPAETHAAVQRHLDACADCRKTVSELRGTFAMLDDWSVPEPPAFFDTRLHARLREEQAARPEGFFERIRSFLLFSTGRQLRPALAGALALALVAGGGSVIGTHVFQAQHASPTVNDLRILDNNAQALQQMDQLLDDSNDDDTPTT